MAAGRVELLVCPLFLRPSFTAKHGPHGQERFEGYNSRHLCSLRQAGNRSVNKYSISDH